MNRLCSFLLNTLWLVGIGLSFAACDTTNVGPIPQPTKKQTVLIYMAAQNSLGYGQYFLQDSTEMMNGAPYLHDGERVLLFIDDAGAPRLYEIARGYGAPKLVKQWKEDLNSADPNTLTEVLNIMKNDFTAEQYGLVLWSHASGWIPGARNYREAHPTTSNPILTSGGKATKMRCAASAP